MEGSVDTWSIEQDGSSKRYKNSAITGGSQISINGDSTWGDYVYTVDIKSDTDETGDYASAVFRYQNVNNFYLAQLMYSTDEIRLLKRVNGTYTQIGSTVPVVLDDGAVYPVKVVLNGTSIKVYVDDVLKIDTTDSTFSIGKVGVRSYNAVNYFDNVRVTTIDGLVTDPEILLVDDFKDEWTVEEGTASTWSVITDSTTKRYKNSATAGNSQISVYGDSDWSDYTYSVDIKNDTDEAGDYASAIFRYRDKNNFYMAMLCYNDNLIRLYKRENGTYTQLVPEVSATLDQGTVYTVRAELIGMSIKVYIDDVLKIDTTDSTFNTGKIGVRSYNAVNYFDNILVD